MQKNIIAILCAGALFAGCAKNKLEENKYWDPQTGNANIRFIHAYNSLTPSVSTPAAGPVVDFFANGVKVSGIFSNTGTVTAIGYGGVFPIFSNGQYASVAPGDVAIKAALYRAAGSTALPTDVITDGKFSLEAGNYYSAFLVDTMPLPAPANVNIAVVKDDVARAKTGFYKMRFAHMIPTTDTLEIVSKNSNTVLLSNITYKTVSNFIELPLNIKNDTIQLRKKGTTVVLTDQKPFFPATEKVYTFYCRGIYTATAGTRARVLTFYTNR
jgi:Domain of unknown function (DUF4397)